MTKQKTETHTTITKEEWEKATGETITHPTTLIYDNEHGDNWYIHIY